MPQIIPGGWFYTVLYHSSVVQPHREKSQTVRFELLAVNLCRPSQRSRKCWPNKVRRLMKSATERHRACFLTQIGTLAIPSAGKVCIIVRYSTPHYRFDVTYIFCIVTWGPRAVQSRLTKPPTRKLLRRSTECSLILKPTENRIAKFHSAATVLAPA